MPHASDRNLCRLLLALLSFVALVCLSACGDVSDGSNSSVSPGVKVTPDNVTLSENGEPGVFSVALNTAPNNDVLIDIASSDITEATANRETLAFTADNWSTAQTVIVAPVDDSAPDGNQTVDIIMTINQDGTADTTGYAALGTSVAVSVPITVVDDDAVGVTISPQAITVTEDGEPAVFTAALNTVPDGDVVIDITNKDASEVSLDKTGLIFTPDDWSEAQVVTVSPLGDSAVDGNQTFDLVVDINGEATVDTTGYKGLSPPAVADVAVTVVDNDAIGVTVISNLGSLLEGRDSGLFEVVLNTAPDGPVVIDILNKDSTETLVDKETLTFTPDNWFTVQTVNVVAVDDQIVDGNQTVRIEVNVNNTPALTTDTTGYADLDPAAVADVMLTVADGDAIGVTVTPEKTTFSEDTDAGSFSVQLNTVPNGNVVINVINTSPAQATVDKSSLTFTADDWSTPQTVRVPAVDDKVVDGNQTFEIVLEVNQNASLTTDTTGYASLGSSVTNVRVTVIDDDSVGITVPSSIASFFERGGSGFFDVTLNSEPNGDVVVLVSSSDTTEAKVDKSVLTFTPGKWSNAQRVTVLGEDDSIEDGNQSVKIILSVDSDPAVTTDTTGYAALETQSVAVTVIDDDAIGVTVEPATFTLNEVGAGSSKFVFIKPNTRPDGNVVIEVSSGDPSEVTLSKQSLTFSPGDWTTAQTVEVFGMEDNQRDGNQPVLVTVRVNKDTALTTDRTGYIELDDNLVPDLRVTVIDNGNSGQ